MTKRVFDITISLLLLTLLSPVMLIIACIIKLTSRGPAIHWSERVGRFNRRFLMPKFRSMRIDTPQLPTHLLLNSQHWITPIGRFIRSTSLDELPQIWSVLTGEMSLVGPRPALFNQDDLVQLRTDCRVHELVPGLTGWAQVNGRDEVSITEKVRLDYHYLCHMSLLFDLRILCRTFLKVLYRDGVRQATENAHPNSSRCENEGRRSQSAA